MVASAEELVFAFTMLPLVLMVGLGLFRVDWAAVVTPPAAGDVDWKLFIQIMFWTSTYWQKVRARNQNAVSRAGVPATLREKLDCTGTYLPIWRPGDLHTVYLTMAYGMHFLGDVFTTGRAGE